MKLTFNIDYHTNPGEHLFISGSVPELGGMDPKKAVELTAASGGRQTISLEISPAAASLSYRYFLHRDDGTERAEWGSDRTIRLDSHLLSATIYDHWQEQPSDKSFYSSAFTDCICRPDTLQTTHSLKSGILRITVKAPMVLPGTTLAITGAGDTLGNWDPILATELNNGSFPTWAIDLPLDTFKGKTTEFKFLLLRESDRSVIGWENGSNRTISLPEMNDNGAVVIAGLHFINPSSLWRGAGVAIPVFSLRSSDDFGVGDFYDLKEMIDWAASTGQKMIQLLPINDTTMSHTWTDSYPYNAISCFALHPMYLRLQEMGQLADRQEQSRFDSLARELNNLPEVDYERVNAAKNKYTQLLFAQQGKAEMTSTAFKKFFTANESWLKPYAAFCVLRDHYRTADMSAWEEYAVYDPIRIDRFIRQHAEETDYIYYIQYHLDRQLRHVRDYAHSKRVAIKGDIPIGISRNSVDAWISPELFNLDFSAGAPPDDFSIMGQNWGFPTYNWDVMARDGFAWWKARFRKMAEYFDAYRIDHVLGFFRIWQIPLDAIHGLLGFFNPALPMTPDEMRFTYDFHFNAADHTHPYIADWMLHDFFGDLTDQVRAQYLESGENGRYRLRPEFSTQRRVADTFSSGTQDDHADRIRNGLTGLIDEVLFIEDPYEKGKYHPRIAAQHTFAYRALDGYQRACYDRLYNDFFYHRHNDFWHGKAMWKLPPVIEATDMLVCAEDLGMIPACVPDVMHRLEILSLEIQRMPKDPATEFADTWRYPYLSVCTTSTHDMGGIRQWWEEDRSVTQRYYNHVLGHGGEAPFYAEPWICRQIIENHLKSPSMLCVLPLQDWLSTDGSLRRNDPREEQINVPANSRHYWRYRMHLTLGELRKAESFNEDITAMIRDSGR